MARGGAVSQGRLGTPLKDALMRRGAPWEGSRASPPLPLPRLCTHQQKKKKKARRTPCQSAVLRRRGQEVNGETLGPGQYQERGRRCCRGLGYSVRRKQEGTESNQSRTTGQESSGSHFQGSCPSPAPPTGGSAACAPPHVHRSERPREPSPGVSTPCVTTFL